MTKTKSVTHVPEHLLPMSPAQTLPLYKWEEPLDNLVVEETSSVLGNLLRN